MERNRGRCKDVMLRLLQEQHLASDHDKEVDLLFRLRLRRLKILQRKLLQDRDDYFQRVVQTVSGSPLLITPALCCICLTSPALMPLPNLPPGAHVLAGHRAAQPQGADGEQEAGQVARPPPWAHPAVRGRAHTGADEGVAPYPPHAHTHTLTDTLYTHFLPSSP